MRGVLAQAEAGLSLQQRFRIARARSRRLLARTSAHTDWMNECVPNMMSYGKDQITAVAACLNMWRETWEENHPDGADDPGPSPKDADPDSPLAEAAAEEKCLALARERLKEWDEGKHPRVPAGSGDPSGQFASSGGGGISGLPAKIEIKDRQLNQALARDAYTFKATELPREKYQSGGPRYRVEVTAKIPPGVEKFEARTSRPSPEYYDPKLAELKTFDKGDLLELTVAKPKEGLSTKIEPLPEKDIIYRGMAAEEYETFLKTGRIETRGDYNFPGQEGLTYWAKDVDSAVSYANSFAPWSYKPTFEKPAYVVAARVPEEIRVIEGTGDNEVGVARPVLKDEIMGLWRGDVYSHAPGDMTLRPVGGSETEYEFGSGTSPSSSTVWSRIEVDDPERQMTPDEEAARRADRMRPENVSEYELPATNYHGPEEWNEKFESEAEFKAAGKAIADYRIARGDGDAYTVNRTLRGKEEMTPRTQQAIDGLDLAFKRTSGPIIDYRSKQPKEAWLYRGISNREQFDLKEGDVFQDNGFISTSVHRSFAETWAQGKGPGGTLIKITAPAGTKVMGILDLSDEQEGETILNRGTKFRVTKVTGRIIEMAVLP
jgi:hypothetical protein